jgi:hypothetical protein
MFNKNPVNRNIARTGKKQKHTQDPGSDYGSMPFDKL